MLRLVFFTIVCGGSLVFALLQQQHSGKLQEQLDAQQQEITQLKMDLDDCVKIAQQQRELAEQERIRAEMNAKLAIEHAQKSSRK